MISGRLALAFLAVVAVGCASRPLSESLALTASLQGRTLQVMWGSALPRGAVLFIAVRHARFNPETSDYRRDRIVQLGFDESTQTFDLSGWPPGEVHATLTFRPLAQLDEGVVAAAGPNGERLGGSQLKTDASGQRYLEIAIVLSLD